jgi:hypothetical protein
VPGLLATVARRIITCELSASVGAPGPRDFTSATLPLVCRLVSVHRIPASRVVTIARNAPLLEAGWGQTTMISEKEKVIYFSREDWTAKSALKRLTKFDFARTSEVGKEGGRMLLILQAATGEPRLCLEPSPFRLNRNGGSCFLF